MLPFPGIAVLLGSTLLGEYVGLPANGNGNPAPSSSFLAPGGSGDALGGFAGADKEPLLQLDEDDSPGAGMTDEDEALLPSLILILVDGLG